MRPEKREEASEERGEDRGEDGGGHLGGGVRLTHIVYTIGGGSQGWEGEG